MLVFEPSKTLSTSRVTNTKADCVNLWVRRLLPPTFQGSWVLGPDDESLLLFRSSPTRWLLSLSFSNGRAPNTHIVRPFAHSTDHSRAFQSHQLCCCRRFASQPNAPSLPFRTTLTLGISPAVLLTLLSEKIPRPTRSFAVPKSKGSVTQSSTRQSPHPTQMGLWFFCTEHTLPTTAVRRDKRATFGAHQQCNSNTNQNTMR